MASKIYLAAQYSRRRELLAYAADLKIAGFDVTSSWLSEQNDGIDNTLMTDPQHEDMIIDLALTDIADIGRSDIVISFTAHPDTPTKRGGRHVEFGYAYASLKRCIVVGWRENIFHHLPEVEHYPTWPEALRAIADVPSRR